MSPPDDVVRNATPPVLRILRDEPLSAVESDAFAHAAFAAALLRILEANAPPLSIGLFGRWGIGKSTVIRILFTEIGKNPKANLFPIYFNAWKYSGDSFRREFLIEVAKTVYGSSDHQEVRRLEQLNYADVLRPVQDEPWYKTLIAALRTPINIRHSGLIRAIFGLIVIAVGGAVSWLIQSAIPAFISAIAALVLKMEFEQIFIIKDTQVFDPKLIFPEQFEREFKALVQPKLLNGKRAVVVIDDLDRCDSASIKDVLITTKNFVEHSNAYFIIPCDDQTVINIFDDGAQKTGYRDEMLRKYFNLGLRIPPISNTDLIDFANRMARDTGLSEEIVQIAVLADYRDARKIKHFANNFLLKKAIAEERKKAGVFKELSTEQELQLAKLVIIEDLAPSIFANLIENPALLQILEESAATEGPHPELEKYKLAGWKEDYPGLKKALLGAKYVAISDLEVLLSLKQDNLALKVPSGSQLRAALLQGDLEKVISILPAVLEKSAQNPLADLLENALARATGPLLTNCISCTLSLLSMGPFQPGDQRRVTRALGNALLQDNQKLLIHPASKVIELRAAMEPQARQVLEDRYLSELQSTVEQPPEIVETATELFAMARDKRGLIKILNDKFLSWSSTQAGLTSLLRLSKVKLAIDGTQFPSEAVIKPLLSALTPVTDDTKLYELRRDVLFANWNDAYAAQVVAALQAALLQEQNSSKFGAPSRFVVNTLIGKPSLLQDPITSQITSQLFNALARVSGDDRDLIRDCVLIIAAKGEPNSKTVARNQLTAIWQSDTDERIRKDLHIATQIQATDIAALVVQSQQDAIDRELQSPYERTRQRITFLLEQGQGSLGGVTRSLMSSLGASADNAFTVWSNWTIELLPSLSDAFTEQVGKKAFEMALAGSYHNRRPQLLRVMNVALPRFQPAEKSTAVSAFLQLLRHSDPGLRSAAVQTLPELAKNADPADFRISLNTTIEEFAHEMSPSQLQTYTDAIGIFVTYHELWNDAGRRSATGIALKLLSTGTAPQQELALTILDKIPGIDAPALSDINHLLTRLAEQGGTFQDRARNLLNKYSSR